MIKIVIWNKWSWLQAPDYILRKVSEALSYEVPNARYTYDKIEVKTLLSKKNAFKTGFLQRVVKVLSDAEVSFDLDDKRNNVYKVDDVVLTLPCGELRPYQKNIVSTIFRESPLIWYRGIIDAATNAGKNWVICAAALTALKAGSRVAITVHRVELFKQLYDFLTENGIEVSRYGTYGNKPFRDLGECTLFMVPTAVGHLMETKLKYHLAGVGTVFVDEAHRSQGDAYKEVLAEMDAAAVIFLSGTPFTGHYLNDLHIIGDSFEVIAKITNKDLIGEGVSQLPTVHFKSLKGWSYAPTYEDELLEITFSDERLQIIKNEILTHQDRIYLICVLTKEHGFELLSNLISLPLVVDFIYSDDPDRARKLQDYKEGRIQVLITTEVLKEGVNMPLINTLINAAWGKSIVWVKQFVGRLIRHDGVNDECTVIDFLDVGHKTREQSLVRLKYYQDEGFKIITE